MSREALEAVRLAVDEVKSVITTLTTDEWQQPSGCAGWRVQDLVAHMSSNYKEVVDPAPPPAAPVALPAERLMDLLVEPRKDWSAAQDRASHCCTSGHSSSCGRYRCREPTALSIRFSRQTDSG